MLKDLGLDLDLTRSKKPFKVQLALPSKVITQNILNIKTANISDVKLNSLPRFEFEIPYLVESKNKGVTDEIEYIKNPDLDNIKEEKLIKLTWYGGRINWFRIMTIEKNDSSDGISTKISCDSLESELRKTNVTIDGTGIGIEEYFNKTLEQSPWKLGYVSNKLKNTYRTFSEQDKQTRYEAIQSGIESYGAITDFDGETRTLNLLTIDELRVFRGVVLKRENYASSIDITSTSEEIVTRMYGKGNEDLDISSANPTGMRYIEDFSYFIHPFKRDANKNVLQHSAYMSDELAHALLDLIELEKTYNPKIDALQKLINQAYVDLTKKMTEKVDLDGEMLTLQALLDTAKSTNNKPLITQRQTEIVSKQKQIDDKVSEIDSINESIELWNKTIINYQEIISTNSFEPKLVEELKLFVYEKDFSDDRYIDAKELYNATVEEFEKYQKPTRSFKTDLTSFINSIESKKYHGRLEIGEEVKIKSSKLGEEYTSIILGYSGDLISGDFQLEISDNMDDIDALDRLATIIYQAESSSSILSNNKYKWNNIVKVKDEVTAWRDKEINTVNNRIVAGANESITIDNRGMMVRNPDFPNEVIIIQSGVVALSRDNGKTWNTSITPNGVIADTLIGKILAGNNLIITNDSGSFVIDNTGMTVNMDSIRIMSGDEGNPKNIIESWNKLLLTYNEIASDSLVNEYEKNQLKLQWNKIEDIHSSMIASFLKGWSQKPVTEPDPNNPNPNPEPNYPDEYGIYIKAYEDLNTYLNTTKQSDGYALLDEANKTKTTMINSEEFKKKFLDYDKAKQALESIISFTYAYSQIKVLEAGISLEYVKNDNVVTALNLSEEGVKIDGKLLEINSKTEFNADLIMNAGVIKGKDDGIIIDLNTGEIKFNKKVTIGEGSNLVTHDDIIPLKGTIVSTLSNDLVTIFTDANGSSGNYDYALTEMNIYKDGVLDNDSWAFSVKRNDNVVYTITKNSVKVLSAKTNSETLVILAKQGKDTIREEFKIKKYAGTTGNVNRWMITPDVIHKTIHDEWVGTPLVIMGNEQSVGKDTIPYSGKYKVYESKDGGLNYFVKYTSSSDESMISYTPTEIGVTHIKLQFYLAGSTLNLIDEQVLPVIIDKNKMYFHTAYSWSVDGKDRFTTTYPNLNLWKNTKSQSYTSTGTTLNVSPRFYELDEKPDNIIGKSATVTFDYEIINSTGTWSGLFRPTYYFIGAGISVSNTQLSGSVKQFIANIDTTNANNTTYAIAVAGIPAGIGVIVKNLKVELGSTATPWMPSASEVTTNDYPRYIGNLTDGYYNSSQNYSDYKWALFKGKDGKTSYIHTAYSWSADGKDSFTTTYPNLNLALNTELLMDTNNTFVWGNKGSATNTITYEKVTVPNQPRLVNGIHVTQTTTGQSGWRSPYYSQTPTVSIPATPNTKYTASTWIKNNSTTPVNISLALGLTPNVNQSPNSFSQTNINVPADGAWHYISYTHTTGNDTNYIWSYVYTVNGTTSADFTFVGYKLEEGDVATPWMQNESEVKTSDYPNYIGTYSDNNVESSLDYKKYQWAIFKGQNSNAYTAYSWSSDGTDRFSTTYPSLNLLKGTKIPASITGNNTANQGGLLFPFDNDKTLANQGFNINDILTLEFDWSATNPASGYFILQWQGVPWGFSLPTINISSTNSSGHVVYTFNVRDKDIASTAYATGIGYRLDNIPTNTVITFSNVIIRKVKGSQPWMPSESEAQDQWQDAIPMYIGVGEKDSQNPADYRWQLNPRYVQASSDSGLSNKAGLDDLASVANTANDALVQAQNAVSNEDYTSWLEHDYQTTIDNLQEVSAQNQEDINNVDDRTTIVEGFYGEMKVKWNFIDESFSFSEEGMFISNAQSKMSIQITSDKIVFWDNNVDVAFITGEVLNIQKGVFLESATIGNHLITKFSDDSPVTIIRYVGGIT